MDWEVLKQYLEDDVQHRTAGLRANQEVLQSLNSNPFSNSNVKSKKNWLIRPTGLLLLGAASAVGAFIPIVHFSTHARAVSEKYVLCSFVPSHEDAVQFRGPNHVRVNRTKGTPREFRIAGK